MSINSRTKGKRGELELAAELSRITGRQWRRAQQRRGTATADVECDGTRLHVECKRVKAGLARMLPWMERDQCISTAIGLTVFVVFPLRLRPPDAARCFPVRPTKLPAIFRAALAQAQRDRGDGMTPLVCVRQDRGEWFAACRVDDLDMIRKELSK